MVINAVKLRESVQCSGRENNRESKLLVGIFQKAKRRLLSVVPLRREFKGLSTSPWFTQKKSAFQIAEAFMSAVTLHFEVIPLCPFREDRKNQKQKNDAVLEAEHSMFKRPLINS